MYFQSKFVLSREHFEECFDQSLLLGKKQPPRYKLMAFLVFAGCAMIIFSHQKTPGFFLIALSFVEYFSFRYRRAWWLMRQMWSRNAHNTITLTIHDQGVKIESLYNNSQLLWDEIRNRAETPKGILLFLKKGGKNYISKAALNEKAIAFIKLKTAKVESNEA